ncbi:MAG: class I SAM-dependent methyltransferase, partial [Tepidiformaceae bacterium]
MTVDNSANAPIDEVKLGNPSFVWRFGQDRRLNLIEEYATLDGARVLDIGCGLGKYVQKFQERGAEAYGLDIDAKRLLEGSKNVPGLMLGISEGLPFADGTFDLVVLNEVIEHVNDDRATMKEARRVLKPGGRVAIYAPNRLYPFETHGIYFHRRYIFGNIPLVNWLPNPLRNRLVPHARAYTKGGIRKTYRGLGFRALTETYVYPGFDNIIARRKKVGAILRTVLYRAEHTPLKT